MVITWKKVKGVKGYQIEYSLKQSFKKSKIVTITKGTASSKTIKKLKAKKKYFVRIRTYIVLIKAKWIIVAVLLSVAVKAVYFS